MFTTPNTPVTPEELRILQYRVYFKINLLLTGFFIAGVINLIRLGIILWNT